MTRSLKHIEFKTQYENKCCKSDVVVAVLDQKIDSDVYKSKIRCGGLYGLTEEEIKIVEGKKV